MGLGYAFVFSTGQLLFGGWAVALLVGWLALRWAIAAGATILALAGRSGRRGRLAATAAGLIGLWWAYRFAFDPNLLGGFHPRCAALALVGALGCVLAATLPHQAVAKAAPLQPLRGEAWPY